MGSNNDTNIKLLQDEQFCQSFEIKALADLLIRKETERWVAGYSDPIVEKEHNSRYMWVSEFVSDKKVLDIACGSGKGSFILAQFGNAQAVTGCDLDSNAIKYASIRNSHPKVSFVADDAQKFTVENKFDVIVSFETIEHLPNVDDFLSGITKLLASDGYFFVSTPISRKTFDSKPENPYHLQEWGFEEFQKMISKHFTVEDVYIQMRFENYASIASNLKRKTLTAIENSKIRTIKEKYLCDSKIMCPVKFDQADSDLFKCNCGVTGYQILAVRSKING